MMRGDPRGSWVVAPLHGGYISYLVHLGDAHDHHDNHGLGRIPGYVMVMLMVVITSWLTTLHIMVGDDTLGGVE